MSYWNRLRSTGIDLTSRYCTSCKTKKHISLFPKHQRYKKSRTCFECLGEIKCRTCNELKSYEEFIDQYKGARKSKVECWECYATRTKAKQRKSYQKRKKEGNLNLIQQKKVNKQDEFHADLVNEEQSTSTQS